MHLQIVFVLVVLLQAWEPALAQTSATEEVESTGIAQKFAKTAGQAVAKIQSAGKTVLGFVGAYYEDHIQPVADSYTEWASNVRSSLREKIWTTIDNMPSKPQD
ncbi:apolipoprotein C-IV [Nematolebias whitei]|uniref:apolipoprotein C-IV n=1 Tax=Nematolebias whitei TaxID=451745 RepID=UPI001897119A|nr:apolipoprotein C-IV [Nematolebias whitei]